MHCLYGNASSEGVKAYLAETLLASHSDLTSEAKLQLRLMTRRHERNLAQLYEAGVKAGVFRRDLDPLLESYLVLGSCNWVSRWYRPGGRWSLDRISESIAETAVAGAVSR
jgi:hypothetical protein